MQRHAVATLRRCATATLVANEESKIDSVGRNERRHCVTNTPNNFYWNSIILVMILLRLKPRRIYEALPHDRA